MSWLRQAETSLREVDDLRPHDLRLFNLRLGETQLRYFVDCPNGLFASRESYRCHPQHDNRPGYKDAWANRLAQKKASLEDGDDRIHIRIGGDK